MGVNKEQTPLQQLAASLQGIYEPRPYMGGIEFRSMNSLDQLKQDIPRLIKANNWPLEVFKTDVRVRSVSVREIKEP